MNKVERTTSEGIGASNVKMEHIDFHSLSTTQPCGPSHPQEKLGDTDQVVAMDGESLN